MAAAPDKKAGQKDSKSKAKDIKELGDVYEHFLSFLKSPMWVLPVMSFIEQRSLVFDKDQGEEKLYKQIHDEFKNMVDMLIQCFCEDLGTKPDQVAQALKKSAQSVKNKTKVEQNMLEPVLAAQDFNIFIHMMMRKNIELQLQALQMIEIVYGLIPAILLPGGPNEAAVVGTDEQEKMIMIEVIRKSKEDFEKEIQLDQKDKEILEKAIKESLQEKTRLEGEIQHEDNMIKKAMNREDDPAQIATTESSAAGKKDKSTAEKQRRGSNDLDLAPLKTKRTQSLTGTGDGAQQKVQIKQMSKEIPEMDESDAAKQMTTSDLQKMMKDKEGVPADAVKDRQAYLRKQRDALLKRKAQARQDAFAKVEAESSTSRPKTAKAARTALGGRGQMGDISGDVLAARKALAEKLKLEVVGKS